MAGPGRDRNLLALEDALKDLEKFDERKVRIVELRFFGGLSVEEAASVVGVAPIHGNAGMGEGQSVAVQNGVE
jgi:hypothetical protein